MTSGGSNKAMMLFLAGYVVGLIAFLAGYIDVVTFLSLPIVLIGGYMIVAWAYPYFKVAGRQFIGVFAYYSSTEAQSCYALVEEITQPEWIYSEMPSALRERGVVAFFVRVRSFPFLPTKTPWDGIIMVFDPEVLSKVGEKDRRLMFDALAFDDYISPSDVNFRIPVKSVFLAGIVVGEYSKERKAEVVLPRWRLVIHKLMRRPESVIERYPIIFVTWSKVHDDAVLEQLRRGVAVDRLLLTSAGISSFIDKLGYVRVRDTEERALITQLEMCQQNLETLDKAIIRHYNPEVAFSRMQVWNWDKPLERLRVNWAVALGIGLLLGGFALLLLWLMGVI